MHIFSISQLLGGVAEYRHYIPARALERLGHTVTYFEHKPMPNDMEKYLLDNAKGFDLLHVGYVVDIPVLNLYVATRSYANIPMITDIDDNIYSVPTANLAFNQYHGGAQERKVSRMHLRVSDAATTTTPSLAKLIASDVRKCAILPNCIDPISWDGIVDPKRAEDKSIRIMLAGSLGHYDDYAEAKDAIIWALDKWDGKEGRQLVRVIFAGWVPDWAMQYNLDSKHPENNRVFQLQYTTPDIYRRLVTWVAPDIIIAPLQTNEFNATKSHIKIYDVAMCGASFLCTDYTPYSFVPDDTCIKVSNTQVQWREAINALVTDGGLRQRLHQHMKEYVLDVWPIDKHIHKWVEFYERVREAPIVQSLGDIVRPA